MNFLKNFIIFIIIFIVFNCRNSQKSSYNKKSSSLLKEPISSNEIELQTPFPSTPPFLQGNPSVASSPDEIFVVWEDGRKGFDLDIFGTILSKEGVLKNDKKNGIPLINFTGNQKNPYLIFDGEKYFLVWEDDRFPESVKIYGSFVTKNGEILQSNGFPISKENVQCKNPVSILKGSQIFVLWEELNDLFEYDIKGAIVNKNGEVSKDIITISDYEGNQIFPSISSDGNSLFVVWEDYKDGGDGGIYGTFLNEKFEPKTPSGFKIVDNEKREGNPCITFLKNNFYIFYEKEGEDGASDIKLALLSSNGKIIKEDIVISNEKGEEKNPFSYASQNLVLVAWDGESENNGLNIYGGRVIEDKILGNEFIKISEIWDDQFKPSIAFDGKNFFAVFQDNRNSWESDIYGTLIEENGKVTNPDGILVSASMNFQGYSSIGRISNSDNYLVVWQDFKNGSDYNILGKRVKISMEVIEKEEILVSSANNDQVYPVVATGKNKYLVVFQDYRNEIDADIYGAMVSKDGKVGVNFEISKKPNDQEYPKATFDGENFFAVWGDWRNGKDFNIYGARITEEGKVIDTEGIIICDFLEDQSYPSVSFANNIYMVVWRDFRGWDADIYGARVSKKGELLDPFGKKISVAEGGQYSPSIASDGTNFFVIWQDFRNPPFADIYGTRIDSSGNVLNPDGIKISGALLNQFWPFLTFNGKNFVGVWFDQRNIFSWDVYGARIDKDGNVIDPEGIPFQKSPKDEVLPVLMFEWGGQHLLSYTVYEETLGAHRIKAKKIHFDIPDGYECNWDGYCLSTFCVNGTCCESKCEKECFSCSNPSSKGKCTKVPDGKQCKDDGNPLTLDFCQNGECVHISKEVADIIVEKEEKIEKEVEEEIKEEKDVIEEELVEKDIFIGEDGKLEEVPLIQEEKSIEIVEGEFFELPIEEIKEFDKKISDVEPSLKEEDILIITKEKGCGCSINEKKNFNIGYILPLLLTIFIFVIVKKNFSLFLILLFFIYTSCEKEGKKEDITIHFLDGGIEKIEEEIIEPPTCHTDEDCSSLSAMLPQCHKMVCDTFLGHCKEVLKLDGEECDDGNPYTKNDECIDGKCIAGPVCACLKHKDCIDSAYNPCYGKIVCKDCKCEYVKGTEIKCDTSKDEECKKNQCNEETGLCEMKNLKDNSPCNDGNLCTEDDSCKSGKCEGKEKICDDKNPCTEDLCDKEKGCVTNNIESVCEDGDPCTINDKCIDGTCKAEEFLNCDDKNPCTTDACIPMVGCSYINNSFLCDDKNPCTEGDYCENGVCVGGNIDTCSCKKVSDLKCGQEVKGTNAGGESTNLIHSYNCSDFDYSGPEYVYELNVEENKKIIVTMTDKKASVDLFLLKEKCSSMSCFVHGFSKIEFKSSKDEKFFLVVDGLDGAKGDYSLKVSCTEIEDCANQKDDDGDKLIDCNDPDCYDSQYCKENPLCSPTTPIDCNLSIAGDTSKEDAKNEISKYGCSGYIYDGGEIIYSFFSTKDQFVYISLSYETGPTDVMVIKDMGYGCDPLQCIAYGISGVGFEAKKGEKFYIAVDGLGGENGSYLMDVACSPTAPVELNCKNGIDDDGDELTDCWDDDCVFAPNCISQEGCQADYPIYCGGKDLWSNDGEGHTENVKLYSCINYLYTGPEYSYSFISEEEKDVIVSLTDESAETEIFVLEDNEDGCDPEQCIAYGPSKAEFKALKNKTYYFVVDGLFGAKGSYKLSVECGEKPKVESPCDDGKDNDFDGLVDCDDEDCKNDPFCKPNGFCTPNKVINCGQEIVDKNDGFGSTNEVQFYSCNGFLYSGPEIAYNFKPNISGNVYVYLEGETAATDILIVENSDGKCDPKKCIVYGTKQVGFYATSGKTYAFVVDGYEGAKGNFSIKVQCSVAVPEFNCYNGADDDGDGQIDCNDPDCKNNPSCIQGIKCAGDWELKCENSDSWATYDKGSTKGVDSYPCAEGKFDGPEYTYKFKAIKDGNIKISLLSKKAQLELFILEEGENGSCQPEKCFAHGENSVSFNVKKDKWYYIVVDGKNGEEGKFTVLLECK